MKKGLVTMLILLLVGGCGAGAFFSVKYQKMYKQVSGEKEVLVTQNAQLQSSIDAIGPVTTAYTVSAKVYSGKVITEEDLIPVSIPQSSVADGETILDPMEVIGKYWKVNVQPGTTVTNSVVMDSGLTETVYEQDMTFSTLPLGIEVGDYVDIKISLPYGQTFYVMTHKRIEQLVIDQLTIKMYLTTTELEIWESACVDYALNKEKGMKLWVSKYVEPGIQDAEAYYPVRSEIADLIKASPNIPDYTVCVSDKVRKAFDAWLMNVDELDKSKLMSGVNQEASGINSARSTYIDSEQSGNAATVGSGTIITPGMNIQQEIENLEGDLNKLDELTQTEEKEEEESDSLDVPIQ